MEAPAWGMGFVKLHPAETKSGSDRKRVNFNAFPAKLLAASPINGARLFIFALTDLCNTLECEPWKYYDFLARKSGLGGALQTPMQVLASDILAVAQWIIHPGNKLLHQGIGLFDDDDDDDAAEQERRHRMIASDTIYGRLRDSVPRDGCWKSRYQSTAEFDDLDLEARKTAAEAVEAMIIAKGWNDSK